MFIISNAGDRSLEDMLSGRPKKDVQAGLLSTMLQFSAQTSSARTQVALTSKLIKKGRDTMGAPKGKRVGIFSLSEPWTQWQSQMSVFLPGSCFLR